MPWKMRQTAKHWRLKNLIKLKTFGGRFCGERRDDEIHREGSRFVARLKICLIMTF